MKNGGLHGEKWDLTNLKMWESKQQKNCEKNWIFDLLKQSDLKKIKAKPNDAVSCN